MKKKLLEEASCSLNRKKQDQEEVLYFFQKMKIMIHEGLRCQFNKMCLPSSPVYPCHFAKFPEFTEFFRQLPGISLEFTEFPRNFWNFAGICEISLEFYRNATPVWTSHAIPRSCLYFCIELPPRQPIFVNIFEFFFFAPKFQATWKPFWEMIVANF